MAREFVQGLNVWIIGWRTILTQRRLLLVTAVPFCLSFMAAVASIWSIWIYYPIVLGALTPAWLAALTGIWHTLVYYPLVFVVGLLAVLASLYVVYVLHALIATPFYSILAERALQVAGKLEGGGAGFSLGMLWTGLLKAAIYIVLGVGLFVFSFIPVLNILSLCGTLLLLAFDCMDYSLEAYQLGLRQRLRYAFRAKAQWAGMAGALALTLLIPGLTLLVIPGAVVGAAMILKEKEIR